MYVCVESRTRVFVSNLNILQFTTASAANARVPDQKQTSIRVPIQIVPVLLRRFLPSLLGEVEVEVFRNSRFE